MRTIQYNKFKVNVMNALIVDRGKFTPGVILDKERNIFEISGRSIPTDAAEFYLPIMKWLEEYLHKPNNKTLMVVELEFINSTSVKVLLNIFKLLGKAFKAGSDIIIEWRYEHDDEDIRESGMDFSSLVQVPFVIKSYQDRRCKVSL